MPAEILRSNGRAAGTRLGESDVSGLPSGTVTFLFTDVEGSTQLLKRLGKRYDDLLAEHHRLLRSAIEAHGGHEVDTQGDSFFVAFHRAKDALAAAVDAQRDLAVHEWPEGVEVKVRMGLHTGEPRVGRERYVGIGVHKAARIGAAGHGGQVLLSHTTRELVEDELPAGVRIRDLGDHRLKDIDGPERLAQLVIEGLPDRFPPLKTFGADLRRKRITTGRGAVVALVVVAAAAAAFLVLRQWPSGGGAAIRPNSVGLVSARSRKVVASVPLDKRTSAIAVAAGSLWATHFSDDTVSRIDLQSRTVRHTFHVGRGPAGIAFGHGAVWVVNSLDGTVSRIDAAANTVVDTIRVGNGPSGITYGRGAIWVANASDHTLSRVDPAGERVTAEVPVSGDATDVAVGEGAIWTANPLEGTVSRVDPDTRLTVDTIHVGNGPSAIATGAGAIWVANSRDGTVSRIDPVTDTVTATTHVGGGPGGIAVDGNAVWVASQFTGKLSVLDARTGAVAHTSDLASSAEAVAVGRGGLWIATGPTARAHRGGTAFTELPVTLQSLSIDSALSYDVVSYGILSITSDGLTGFTRAAGNAQLVPDLATRLPAPANGGRTFTFTLRKGIRYSTGMRVRASDFRRAIERVLVLGSEGAQLYNSIIGARACLKPLRCDLSRGIIADDAAGTVTFRLVSPDPDFLYKLSLNFAYPVPPGTAYPKKVGTGQWRERPIPGTGPYMVAALGRKELRLVRNPEFHEWSKAAQPDGYPDELVFALRGELDNRDAIHAVDAGKLDWFSWPEPTILPKLLLRYRSQLRVNTRQGTVYMSLNTRLPPFDDVRVRRALNYAVDRDALAARIGRVLATPTCQVLPPSFPGYERYCRYRGPNVAKAQSLVDASATRGMKVVVWTMPLGPTGQYFVSLLRELGYQASLKVWPLEERSLNAYLAAIGNPRNKVQIAWNAWEPDYPSAANFFEGLRCDAPPIANSAGFCSRRIDALIARARALQTSNTQAANRLWARIDRAVMDQAPWVPTINPNSVTLLSRRAGNYQYNARLGMLIDQLWVR